MNSPFRRRRAGRWLRRVVGVLLSGWLRASAFGSPDGSPSLQLGIWCEFMPYREVLPHLPLLARYRCDLLLHVNRHEVGDPDLARVYREAREQGVVVKAWLLLPYDQHLYVGEDTLDATRELALAFADWAERERLDARWIVFDCEPSPLLGRQLFAHVRHLRPVALARTLRAEKDAERFLQSIEALKRLVAELKARQFRVMGAANRVFLDFLRYGNVTAQDALNAPFSMIPWDQTSYITYRYHATQSQYVTMVNRYALLARRFHGEEAALDLGLIGDQSGIPEHHERARLFGGEKRFLSYLQGMRSTQDLREAVSVAVSRGVHRVQLYSLDGAVRSEAGLENWLKAASESRSATGLRRWTPIGSLRAGLLGAALQGLFHVAVGEHPRDFAAAALPAVGEIGR